MKSQEGTALSDLLPGILDHYHQALLGSNRRGLDYLKTCGLGDMAMLIHFRIGYVDSTLKAKLTPTQIKQAQQMGLFTDAEEETLTNRIVVPVFNDAGLPVALCGYDIGGKTEGKCLDLAGQHYGLWNGASATAYPEELILTDDTLDGLALWQAGIKNVIAILGDQSASVAFFQKHNVRKVVLAFANEGKEFVSELAAQGIKVHRLQWPEGTQGARSYFPKGTAKMFAALVAAAPQIGFTREKENRLMLMERTADTALFKGDKISYRLRGINQTDLRVVLTAKTEKANHVDHLDLYANRARKLFGAACAERLGLDSTRIEKDLLELLERVELFQKEEASPTAIVPILTPEQERTAKAFLQAPNLLDQIAADLEAIGYVGEERNKKLAYLVATSRRLPKPLSGIFRAQSGSGKSYLMECVAELMPPEDVHYFSRLTPQALYYLEPDSLVHKLLIVDERDGSEDSEYPIRTLQTRRVLKLAVPGKDPSSGKIRTTVLEIRGPIAYMESTTDQQINPENANRCFELYLDESEKQTRSIFAAQRRARTLEGWQVERRKEKILKLHHNAQRMLRPLKVIIPYVELIEFPASWLRGRRDNDRFLSLIEGIAFLHQHQRPIGTDKSSPGEPPIEYIETNLDDYAHAYDLAHQVFVEAGSDLPKPVADFFGQMEKAVERLAQEREIDLEAFTFSRRDIREAIKFPDHLVKRYMHQLEELEYVRVKRAPQGGSYRYRMAEAVNRPHQLDGLITPDALREKWDKWNKSGTGRLSRLSDTP